MAAGLRVEGAAGQRCPGTRRNRNAGSGDTGRSRRCAARGHDGWQFRGSGRRFDASCSGELRADLEGLWQRLAALK